MCGIALIVGAGADPGVFRQMTRLLAARGETEESILAPGLFACTQRLRIVDRDHAVQPWLSADRRWLLCYNGEIFNHHELRAELAALTNDAGLIKALGDAVSRVNATLPAIERVRRFIIAREAFTTANGQLTPTLKVKRHIVRAVYRDALEALYEAKSPAA